MIKTTLTAVALASLLAACGSLPATQTPALELPTAFRHADGFASGATQAEAGWAAFGDPVLDDLVRRGLAANLDLQQAAERVQRSRALAAGAHAERAPSGGLVAATRTQQLAAFEAPGQDRDARRSDPASLGASVGWEIDLFGRLRNAAGAADARTLATAADAQALRLVIGAEIAQAWFALNGSREQLRLARATVENRQRTVDLVSRRTRAGYGAPLDEARARADLAAAAAEIPVHEAASAVASHRLAVLMGSLPSTFEAPAAVTVAPRPLALRVPEPRQWATQRPDLQAAEARLRAQALDVEAVRAEFLPRLSIAGVLGFVAGSVSGLGAAGSASWFVAPSVSLPVFDRGRIDARLQAARSGEREALLAYRKRVLLATEEVESALVEVRQGQVRVAALQDRARHAAAAEDLARKRFEAGASDLLELLDAHRTAQQAESALVAALTAQQQQLVVLQRALGMTFDAGVA